ncbi:hypothetical protein PI125_g21719 [Phytophthora idaei]|nr:hypothetical protein PI125_g21719 [Phytophthora idaei]
MTCKKDESDVQTRSIPDNWDASHILSLKDKVTIVTGATLASTSSGPLSLLVTAGMPFWHVAIRSEALPLLKPFEKR